MTLFVIDIALCYQVSKSIPTSDIHLMEKNQQAMARIYQNT